MPDQTDDAQQPPRRTTTLPPLFTPRVTRSNTPVRDAAAARARRSSRLFTPPRVTRQTPPAPAEAPAPAQQPVEPATPLAAAPAAEAPVAQDATAGAPVGSAPAPDERFAEGDIETADIALSASAGSELIARQEATVPEAEAASAIVDEAPDAPEPRNTIEGVEIERPVWTFTPAGVRSVPAVPLPAEPAAPAEPHEPPPALEDVERPPDAGTLQSAGPPREPPGVEEWLEIERASLARPSAADVAEEEVVAQEVEVAEGAAPAKAPDLAAAPGDLAAEETSSSRVSASPGGDADVPAVAAHTAPVASPADEVEEAWAAATRPDGEEGGADTIPGAEPVDTRMQEAPRPHPAAPGSASEPRDAEAMAREVDEMTAALGWPDSGDESHAASGGDGAAALRALDAELRTTAALFAAASGDSPEGDVAAALERIARRIRDGQVVLPRDAVAASEESALAVTLAALLKGPPHG